MLLHQDFFSYLHISVLSIKMLNFKKINQKIDSYCHYCYYCAVLSFRKSKKAVGVVATATQKFL